MKQSHLVSLTLRIVHTSSGEDEDVPVSEEDTKALVVENTHVLEAQVEERPLAKKQEEIDDKDEGNPGETDEISSTNEQTANESKEEGSSNSTHSPDESQEKHHHHRKALLKNDDSELTRVQMVSLSFTGESHLLLT